MSYETKLGWHPRQCIFVLPSFLPPWQDGLCAFRSLEDCSFLLVWEDTNDRKFAMMTLRKRELHAPGCPLYTLCLHMTGQGPRAAAHCWMVQHTTLRSLTHLVEWSITHPFVMYLKVQELHYTKKIRLPLLVASSLTGGYLDVYPEHNL